MSIDQTIHSKYVCLLLSDIGLVHELRAMALGPFLGNLIPSQHDLNILTDDLYWPREAM